MYHNVPGKCPWALQHNLRFWPARALTRDKNFICLYRSCYIEPLKWGTWALTQEWAFARNVHYSIMVNSVCTCAHVCISWVCCGIIVMNINVPELDIISSSNLLFYCYVVQSMRYNNNNYEKLQGLDGA